MVIHTFQNLVANVGGFGFQIQYISNYHNSLSIDKIASRITNFNHRCGELGDTILNSQLMTY